ncbi:MAG: NB-ARC domain-containing protein, partial [Ktedonobacteraceae bacterium]
MGRRDKTIQHENGKTLPPGAQLRQVRQKNEIALTAMAKLLGYSKSYLSRVENGDVTASQELIEKYEDTLKLEKGELTRAIHGSEGTPGREDTPSSYKNRHERGKREKVIKEDWGELPVVTHFYGRADELSDLKHWLVDERDQLVVVLGLGGIGKTSIAVLTAEQTKHRFSYIFWRSLQNAPAAETIVRSCILFLSDYKEMHIPDELNEQILLLIDYVRKQPCLIVLDNLEAVLGSDERSPLFQGYRLLLQRIGEVKHKSCFLLTSREKPREIAILEAKSMPVRSMQLVGLQQKDAQKILEEKGLPGKPEEQARLVNAYGGNPLALKLVAEFIREVFGGNIAEFLEQPELIVENVYELLNQQFTRLSDLESNIMYWLAIEREDVSLDDLQADLTEPVIERKLLDAVDSLQRRSMIEKKGGTRYFLQPLIMEYVTRRIVEQVYDEIDTQEWKLLGSHVLTKAQAKVYVRESQKRLILAPIASRLVNTWGQDEGVKKLKSLFADIRNRQSQTAMYAAANVLKLLLQLRADLRGTDFSSLHVRQVYLQGVSLPGVNFTHADLAQSLFTDTFGSILAIALSPNGKYLAAGTASGVIRLWDATNSMPLATYHSHKDWVRTVAFSPDSRLLASGSDDTSIWLWDVQAGHGIRRLDGHEHRVRSVVFSPDSHLLASGSDDTTLRLWDLATYDNVKILKRHELRVRSVAFSPDGRLLASGSDDKTILLWEVQTGRYIQRLEGHRHRVRSVAFSPDGRLLASGSDDTSILLWDVQTGHCTRHLEGHKHRVRSVAFSPDGRLLASGGDDTAIFLWEVQTGQRVRHLAGHESSVRSVIFDTEGNRLLSGSDDETIRFWQVDTGHCLKLLQGYSNWVYSVAFSPGGNLLASGYQDNAVRLWDLRDLRDVPFPRLLQEHLGVVYSVAFNGTGNILASGSLDRTVCIWDVNTGECLATLAGHSDQVNSVAFSPDGRLLASGSEDNIVRLWDLTSYRCLTTLKGHSNRVRTVAFSPDGSRLASGSEDATVRIWDARSYQRLATLKGHRDQVRSVAFHPDGCLLVSASEDNTVRLWDLTTYRCLKMLTGHSNRVRAVAFSPDGSILASGSEDTTVRIWDTKTGNCLKILTGHAGLVYGVTFKMDNRTVASGSYDGTIRLWDAQTGGCLHTLKSERPYEKMNITGA